MSQTLKSSPQEFARLLTEGIYGIKAQNPDLTIHQIQEDLGDALGRDSGKSSVEYWRRRNIPTDWEDVELLAKELVRRGNMDKAWASAFLHHGRHPYPARVLAELFAEPEPSSPTAPPIQKTKDQPSSNGSNRPPKQNVALSNIKSTPAESAPSFSDLPQRHKLLLAVMLIAVIGSGIFYAFWPEDTPPLTLQNPGFEDGTNHWYTDAGCELETWRIEDSRSKAKSGRQFAVLASDTTDCYSLRQEVHLPVITTTTTFRVSAWMRSGDETPRAVGVQLWTGTSDMRERFVYNDWENSEGGHFELADEAWQCVETAVTLPPTTKNEQLRVEFYLETQDGRPYHLDDIGLSIGDDPICEPPFHLLRNADFETGSINPWESYGDCHLENVSNETTEENTGRALRVSSSTGCDSLYQDTTFAPASGETYYLSTKVRTENQPAEVKLALWTQGDGSPVNAAQTQIVDSSDWHCITAVLTVLGDEHTHLRGELYFETLDRVYLIDEMMLSRDPTTSCPLPDLEIRHFELLETDGYPGGNIDVEVEIRNIGAVTTNENEAVLWVYSHTITTPIGLDYQLLPIPELAPGENTGRIIVDVPVPDYLEAGTYELALRLDHQAQISEESEKNNVDRRPITILECHDGTDFCDVGADHWARPEIETWAATAITGGCRETETGRQLFCPTTAVSKDIMAIFFVRKVFGGSAGDNLKPYQGYFADITADTHFFAWMEATVEGGILMKDACTDAATETIFCAQHQVTHADLARYLAETLDWNLRPVTGTTFNDITADDDTLSARAAEYMARHDIIRPGDQHCPEADDGMFCPDQYLTRATAAAWTERAFEHSR